MFCIWSWKIFLLLFLARERSSSRVGTFLLRQKETVLLYTKNLTWPLLGNWDCPLPWEDDGFFAEGQDLFWTHFARHASHALHSAGKPTQKASHTNQITRMIQAFHQPHHLVSHQLCSHPVGENVLETNRHAYFYRLYKYKQSHSRTYKSWEHCRILGSGFRV